MATIPLLDLGAEPFERGVIHGRRLAAEVRAVIETYLARFALNGLSADEARRRGAAAATMIGRRTPDYGREMEGIAQGAGLPLADIGLLNARYEISYGVFGSEIRTAAGSADGCTAFALMPEHTKSGEVTIGQNWDWLEGLRGNLAVLRVRPERRPAFLVVTQAGIAGGMMGLNQAGIGLAVNGLTTAEDGKHPSDRPFHVRVRQILESRSYEEALNQVIGEDRTCSSHFLIAHAEEEAMGIEAAPRRAHYLHPTDGIYTHANHFEVGPDDGMGMERLGANTLYRPRRLERHLRRANRPHDLATIRAGLTDHFSAPRAICRHADPEDVPARRLITVASVVLQLKSRTMHVSDGPPCDNAYQSFTLN
ncbi:MAG: hypothetical protein FJX46_05150 [Alphaproteobacteria bacterium]|nr:hypothetical protein [Alphaproteobacteria bacterium]